MELLPGSRLLYKTGPLVPLKCHAVEITNCRLRLTRLDSSDLRTIKSIQEYCNSPNSYCGLKFHHLRVRPGATFVLQLQIEHTVLSTNNDNTSNNTYEQSSQDKDSPFIIYWESAALGNTTQTNNNNAFLRGVFHPHIATSANNKHNVYCKINIPATSLLFPNDSVYAINVYILLYDSQSIIVDLSEYAFECDSAQTSFIRCIPSPCIHSQALPKDRSIFHHYFDATYVLNAPANYQRWHQMNLNLKQFGIYAKRVKLDQDTLQEQLKALVKLTKFASKQLDWTAILVLRDDQLIHQNAEALLQYHFSKIHQDVWHLSCLGGSGVITNVSSELPEKTSNTSGIKIANKQRLTQPTGNKGWLEQPDNDADLLLWKRRLGAIGIHKRSMLWLLESIVQQGQSLFNSMQQHLKSPNELYICEPSIFTMGMYSSTHNNSMIGSNNHDTESKINNFSVSHSLLNYSNSTDFEQDTTQYQYLDDFMDKNVSIWLKLWTSYQKTIGDNDKKNNMKEMEQIKNHYVMSSSVENQLSIVLYLDSQNIGQAKVDLHLTLLNLLRQTYQGWQLVLWISPSFHTNELLSEMDVWRRVLSGATSKGSIASHVIDSSVDSNILFKHSQALDPSLSERVQQTCKGKYLIFWNAAWWSSPERLQCIVASLDQQSSCIVMTPFKVCVKAQCWTSRFKNISSHTIRHGTDPFNDLILEKEIEAVNEPSTEQSTGQSIVASKAHVNLIWFQSAWCKTTLIRWSANSIMWYEYLNDDHPLIDWLSSSSVFGSVE